MSLSWYIEDSCSIYKYCFILYLKLPLNVKSLRSFQPVFNGYVVDLMLFSLASDVICFSYWGRRSCSYKTIHQGRSIRNGEEQRSRMFLVFHIHNFLVFSHRQGIVYNFIVSLSIGVDLNKLFTSKVVKLTIITDRCFYFPGFSCWIL